MILRTSSPDFDSSHIFIGREQQLDLFAIYLARWKKLMAEASLDIQVTTQPSPNNRIQGLVILLYGRGGFGKSTLLKHYRSIAQEPGSNLVVSEIVDWEFAIEGKRSLLNPMPGQEVDAPAYFRLLCSQLALALSKRIDDFKEYQLATKAVEDARKQANAVLYNLQKESRSVELHGLTIDDPGGLFRSILPGSTLGKESVKEAAYSGAQITVEQLAHIYTAFL